MGKNYNHFLMPKYRDEYFDMLYKYLYVDNKSPTTKREYEDKAGNKIEEIGAADLPTIEEFARILMVSSATVRVWAIEEYPEGHRQAGELVRPGFNELFAQIKDAQTHFLVANGLSGRYNTRFATFVAKNTIDWKEKSENEVKGEIGHNMSGVKLYIPENNR